MSLWCSCGLISVPLVSLWLPLEFISSAELRWCPLDGLASSVCVPLVPLWSPSDILDSLLTQLSLLTLLTLFNLLTLLILLTLLTLLILLTLLTLLTLLDSCPWPRSAKDQQIRTKKD